jgi:hypothetical protein
MNGKITFVSYSRIQNGISISGVAAINFKSVIIFNLNQILLKVIKIYQQHHQLQDYLLNIV